MTKPWFLAFLCFLLLAISTPARAHLTPNSEIGLAIGGHAVSVDVIVPQGEYAFATGHPVGNKPEALALARAYLSQHLALRGEDGRPWPLRFETVEFAQIAGPPDLHAVAYATPPEGQSPRRFGLQWDGVVREVPGHFALIVVTSDSGASLGAEREIIGAIRADQTTLAIDRGHPDHFVAFLNSVWLGIGHIIAGYDHMLFLLALLLPAPLIAAAGRWGEARSLRETLGKLVRIVTGFTVGHSLTLVGATLFRLQLPVAPVEVAIAISVLVSAVHAIRPIFPGREPFVALAFGLVHGLAFATLLADAGVGAQSGALALLGFNLGIEAVQLGLVALVVPPLVVLARGRHYTPIRLGLASVTALASVAWIWNRTTGTAGIVVDWLETAMAFGPVLIVALAVLASVHLFTARQRNSG